MAKVYSEFVCQQCGYRSASFLGKCPNCGEWNSLVESVPDSSENFKFKISNLKFEENLVKLSEVKSQNLPRITTGFSEFDRVLGGGPPASEAGIVPGSIVLIAGDPGIGKSTLLLQTAMKIAELPQVRKVRKVRNEEGQGAFRASRTSDTSRTSVLYVTGEESAQQVKLRADRVVGGFQLAVDSKKKSANSRSLTDNFYILPQTDVEAILAASEKLAPSLLIVDSIQTLTTDKLSTSAGSIGQVRECAQILQRYAKASGTPIFLVGHVTKEGAVAGPKVLEHLVDAVLNLEGDGTHAFRLLRSVKNRFGSTFEVGVFEMADSGMREVLNPSEIFLSQRIAKRPGSVVTSTMAGGRPLLVEIQALTTPTIYSVPIRRATGLDFNRMQIVLASLLRSANLQLASFDIYLNVAGGLKISEPAADLAAALSIVSVTVDKPIREGVCAFGEVGLLGELRQVANSENRLKEAKRLGFSDFVTPAKFRTLEEAVTYSVHGG